MAAVSSISAMKVETPRSWQSPAPTRAKIASLQMQPSVSTASRNLMMSFHEDAAPVQRSHPCLSNPPPAQHHQHLGAGVLQQSLEGAAPGIRFTLWRCRPVPLLAQPGTMQGGIHQQSTEAGRAKVARLQAPPPPCPNEKCMQAACSLQEALKFLEQSAAPLSARS